MEDYEKKYNSAMEVMRQWIAPCHTQEQLNVLKTSVFPELKESWDERIRKAIIMFFELQDDNTTYSFIPKKDILAWLEKQGEQKPTDKVEPKFKVGDWVIYKGDICQIVKREEGCNKLVTNFGIEKELVNERNLSTARLWTIQDAKAGDVLYLQKDGKEHIIIYKGVIKERFRTFVSAYCAYNGIVDAFCFADVSRYVDIAYGGIMPATKEQRETFERAMTNAGYRWDKEKLKLEKI